MIARLWLAFLALTVFAIASTVRVSQALPAPPPNADPMLAPWFQSLQRPNGAGSCCADSDGRPVDYRIVGDHYEALVGAQFPGGPDPAIWVSVPPESILQRHDNPTGRAVLFWRPKTGVLCFIRPAEY